MAINLTDDPFIEMIQFFMEKSGKIILHYMIHWLLNGKWKRNLI